MYKRPLFQTLQSRLKEPRRFLQVLAGPRQAGKTTLARQAMEGGRTRSHYASADEPTLQDRAWIEQQWDLGRLKAKDGGALLVLDEVQKVPGWSEVVKRLWDEDTAKGVSLKCVLLGSSPLLVQRGLTESLAGRFEILHVTHWSFAEMRDAFGWDVDRYVYFGGYPGAAALIEDRQRWARYIVESLIETTLSRDILLMTRVDKPALLRRLFLLGCDYSGQILSYQKMLGQLQDAGNTTTLAHYLELIAGAGMLKGVPKFSGKKVLQRGSSPKLQVLNTALVTSQSRLSYASARKDRDYWGRLVESSVGAHLLNGAEGTMLEIYYWRDRGHEVDFVLQSGDRIVLVEVKSGRARAEYSGMNAFAKNFRPYRRLLVGGQGIPLEEFLATPILHWVE
ncbi:MAG: AAA family ATPase [Deltaproteobacteria bacterium RBG_16_64_85]|nr:MAG: AAA family ATPase [Deltaproteobacteria bacterium RBG_16_64_85]